MNKDFLVYVIAAVLVVVFSSVGGIIESNLKIKKEIEISKVAMENGYEQIDGNWVKVVCKSENGDKVEKER